MCLLTYLPEEIQPNIEALRLGAAGNPDGHGFAIVIPGKGGKDCDGKILVRKSMKVDGILKEFARLREQHPHGPAIFHSRITTDGITDLFNCHPFMVNHDKRTVIGHNGILPRSMRPGKEDIRSDTRIFAEQAASGFRLETLIGRQLAGEWMGAYNKMAVLTVDPIYDQYGYLINEEEGIWCEGIWYSNTSFQGTRKSYGNYVNGTYFEGAKGGFTYRWNPGSETWDKWEWCGSKDCTADYASVSPVTLRCVKCRACGLCDLDPCTCVLVEPATGKATPPSVEAKGSIVVGSPRNGATVHKEQNTLAVYVTSVEEYQEALAAVADMQSGHYNYSDIDPEDDPADHKPSQLAEALALVDFLNNGGDVDDLSEAQQDLLMERTRRLTAKHDAIVEGTVSAAEGHAEASTVAEGTQTPGTDLVKRGDVSDDQDAMMLIAAAQGRGMGYLD